MRDSIQEILQSLPFKDELKVIGGEIYAVGGCVRDQLIAKDYKDIDLLVTGVSQQRLIDKLGRFGKTDLVGVSFGVIKWRPFGSTEEYDIAVPRIERKNGEGHTDFEVDAGPHITLEEDLYRRDFTINAIAMSSTGKIIDPFGGVDDLIHSRLKLVNADGFSDDPLRMLRAIQFASRFDLKFEIETLASLVESAPKIQTVSKERILIELEKIAFKGDCGYAAKLLENTGLHKQIFADLHTASDYYVNHKNIKTVGELIIYLTGATKSAIFYKDVLKGTTSVYKEIKALQKLFELYGIALKDEDVLKERLIIFDAYNLHADAISTTIFDAKLRPLSKAIDRYVKAGYPLTRGDLACNGEEVMEIGFRGPQITVVLRQVLEAILKDEIKNTNEEIIKFLTEEKKYL